MMTVVRAGNSLEEVLRKFPRETFFRSGEREYSFAEFHRRAAEMAANLQKRGVSKGDRLALLAPASAEFLLAIWATWMLGAIAVPLNTRWSPAEVEDACRQVGCRYIIGEPLPAISARAVQPLTFPMLLEGKSPAAEPELVVNNQPASIIFTSGSTGKPKGVVHSLANHVASALGSAANLPLAPGDVWLLSLPLFHVGGLAIPIRCWLGGATVAIPAPRQPLAEQIARFRPTHLSLVGTQLFRLMEDETSVRLLASAKAVLLGGSAVPKSLIQNALEKGIPVLTSYGSSEMASQICTTPANQPELSLLGSGKLLPGRELRMAPNGEIQVKGDTLALGYWKDNGVTSLPLREGWLPTGDRGRWRTDNILEVLGRLDNLFISGGENIYPEEIEEAILQLPEVRQALAVPLPDREFGQRPAVFIEWSGPKRLTLEELRERLQKKLAGYKLPVRLLNWPAEFPQKSIKPDRKYFKELALRKKNKSSV
ncbi:MAG: o-succinylbenzoate--CoA ligase [Calditrichia bacterium]